jgi:hypothetical protein
MIELVELQRIKRAAEAMLTAIVTGAPEDLVRNLRPRDDDYARVFTPDAAETARTGYLSLWNAPPKALHKAGQTQVIAFACDAESLRTDNEFSRSFPGGYQRIAGFLEPKMVWLAFKTVVPGQSTGMAYDGLVYLDDHWAWFPKPWRILSSGEAN